MSDSSSSNNHRRANPPHLAVRLSKQFRSHFQPESEPEQPTEPRESQNNSPIESRESQNTLFSQQLPNLPTPPTKPSLLPAIQRQRSRHYEEEHTANLNETFARLENFHQTEPPTIQTRPIETQEMPSQGSSTVTAHSQSESEISYRSQREGSPMESNEPYRGSKTLAANTFGYRANNPEYNVYQPMQSSKGKGPPGNPDGGGGGGGGGGGFFGQPQQHNPQNNYRGIKYDLPKEFNGTAQDYQRWKEQLSLYFLANRDQLPSDHDIIICALYNMGEGASFWRRDFLTHHMQNGVPTFGSTEAFWQALDQSFLPFNESESFLRKWLTLKQLQRPVETYIMEFRILANRAGVRETQQLIHQFREGLDPSIAIRAISKHPGNNLEEWFTAARAAEETERMEADYYRRHPQIYS
ncbi:hypothetical protein D9756_004603 [Leucocoprinus leucothites]|uniref:Retrotransposon gag domain-containing protein n=1 Tax=Leucocoprinus leucothites TaxID=201217 RepID=A0A8H5G9W4_9AGAR|nr:hypothetical protein D9756_004603 [Leucoagaricus leucothites]